MTRAENSQGIPNEGIPVVDYREGFQSTPPETTESNRGYYLDFLIRSRAVTEPGAGPQEFTPPTIEPTSEINAEEAAQEQSSMGFETSTNIR